MAGKIRSPFGNVLREYRQALGMSQVALSAEIDLRAAKDPVLRSLGGVTDKAIANLEKAHARPESFVRPRPQTVRILANALNLEAGSDNERRFIEAAEQTRDRAPIRRRRRSGHKRPLFVRAGREDQLSHLTQAWQRAYQGEPQFIHLAGNAGTGKTHMVRELCSEIQHESADVRIVWGECSLGAVEIDPWLPFFQVMNRLLGLTDHEYEPGISSAPIKARQVSAIETLLNTAPTLIGPLVDERALTTEVETLAEADPHLKTTFDQVIGARFTSETSTRLDQLTRFFARCAASGPIIVVLEDIHWANRKIIAALLHLHRQLSDRQGIPLLVISTYRPSDLVQPAHAEQHPLQSAIIEIQRMNPATIIDLDTSIGASRGRAFINGLTQNLYLDEAYRKQLAHFLFERTEGHPLFAVELLGWLQDTGKLDKKTHPTTSLTFPALMADAPKRIQAVIASRLDRLPTNLREVMEGASIQGNTVIIDMIPNTGTLMGDQVAEVIEDDIVPRYRLLEPIEPVVIAGQRFHRCRFQHVLFQQYLYTSLSPARQERLQARTAEKMVALLGAGPHSGAGDIAFHFAKAGRFADAATHASHAGAYALRQLNFDMAEYWFSQAERHSRNVDDLWSALSARNGRIAALRGMAKMDEAIHMARELIVDIRAHGFRDLEAETAYLLGQMYYDQGRSHEAITLLQASAAIDRELGRPIELSRSESMMSHAYYLLGAYDDALSHAHASWESVKDEKDASFGAEGLLAAGNCEADLGRYDAAIATYARARVAYTRVHEIRGELYCDLNISLCCIQLERCEEALTLLQMCQKRTAPLQLSRVRAVTSQYLGLVLTMRDQLDEADAALREAHAVRKRINHTGHLCDTTAAIIRVDLRRKAHDRVAEHLEDLQRMIRICNGENMEDPIAVWLTVADACHALGMDDDASAAVRTGHSLLMARASHISDPDARHSYLTNVPANRKIIQQFRELSVNPVTNH